MGNADKARDKAFEKAVTEAVTKLMREFKEETGRIPPGVEIRIGGYYVRLVMNP